MPVTKKDHDDVAYRYEMGESCGAIARDYDVAPMAVWRLLKKLGVESRKQVEYPVGHTRERPHADPPRVEIKVSNKPNRWRMATRVLAERRLKGKLEKGQYVEQIDGDWRNVDENNLRIVTRSGEAA